MAYWTKRRTAVRGGIRIRNATVAFAIAAIITSSFAISSPAASGGMPASPLPREPQSLTQVGDRLFFVANDPEHGWEVWTSDGTREGTHIVKDINPVSDTGYGYRQPMLMRAWRGELYFSWFNESSGVELWKTDGTKKGTVLVKDHRPGALRPEWLTAMGGALYFLKGDSGELWKSDGTADGTVMVSNAPQGGWTTGGLRAAPNDNMLFFHSDDELWKSDGTTIGTVPVKSVRDPAAPPGAYSNIISGAIFIHPNGLVYFLANDGSGPTHGEDEYSEMDLWRSDGTAPGTFKLKDWTTPRPLGYDEIGMPVALGDSVLFEGWDESHGLELWKTGGSESDTKLLKDINPGPGRGVPNFVYDNGSVIDERHLFSATDGEHGFELWTTDGTTSGTKLLTDIRPGRKGSFPRSFQMIRSRAYFVAKDGRHGNELWRTNGTRDGTRMVTDINPNGNSVAAGIDNLDLTPVRSGALYFLATDGKHPEELWKLGTSGRARPLRKI